MRSNTKGSVVHIGAVGEVPDFVAWSTEEANASIAIVAAREEPGFRDEAAQFGLFRLFRQGRHGGVSRPRRPLHNGIFRQDRCGGNWTSAHGAQAMKAWLH